MADQAVADQQRCTRRLGEEYEVFEGGTRVVVRAIAPPGIIKDFLASKNCEQSGPQKLPVQHRVD